MSSQERDSTSKRTQMRVIVTIPVLYAEIFQYDCDSTIKTGQYDFYDQQQSYETGDNQGHL